MPDLFAGWPNREKDDAVEALTHFLASTGGLPHARLDRKAVAAGKTLYHQVGCAVCHGRDRREDGGRPPRSPVPLGPLEAKYTIPSLTAFLLDPLKARPSGRMPALRLKTEEASQIAQFLLRDLQGEFRPNLEYRYYEAEGPWDKLPDFSKLKPTSTGQADGFDLSVARRKDNVALRFQGVLRIDREGRYTFFTTSDDGSKLYIDDNLVVDNDGIHPRRRSGATYRLGKGDHRVAVEFFNAGGGDRAGRRVRGARPAPPAARRLRHARRRARREPTSRKADDGGSRSTPNSSRRAGSCSPGSAARRATSSRSTTRPIAADDARPPRWPRSRPARAAWPRRRARRRRAST